MKIQYQRGRRIMGLPLFIILAGSGVLAGCGEESDKAAGGTAPPAEESAPAEPVAESPAAGPEAGLETKPAAEDPGPHIDTDPEQTPETVAAETPAEPAAPVSGGEVYNTYCVLCHRTGLNMAPKFGNKIIWSRVVAKGRETVYRNSLEGIRGMPPRGGYAFLTDEQIKAAVDFMVQAGGGWRE